MGKNKYPFELKKVIVEEYLEGHSPVDLVEKFNVDRRRIHEWVKKAKKEGFDSLKERRGKKSKGKRKMKKEEPTLEEKYEKLQMENAYLKKLLDLKRG